MQADTKKGGRKAALMNLIAGRPYSAASSELPDVLPKFTV
jgi:hypothetical protein